MPSSQRRLSRRAVLAASGIATAGLAGCSAITGPAGTPATLVSDRDIRPDDGTVVARAGAETVDCPRGDVELRGAVVENNETGEDLGPDLQLYTEIDVFPGRQECDSDWLHDGIDVTHDWVALGFETKSAVTETASNVRYVDDGNATMGLRSRSSTATGEWLIRLAEGRGQPHSYVFRSQ